MLFLLTCEDADAKFIETLVETTKIVTIRLVHHRDEYKLVVTDVNDSNFTARFKTEGLLRTRLAQLLVAMDSDISLADTMKIAKKPDSEDRDLVDRIFDALKKA